MNTKDPAAYLWILGIEASQEQIGACLINTRNLQCINCRFENSLEGFRELRKWNNDHGNAMNESTLVCMYYSGPESRSVLRFMLKHRIKVWSKSFLFEKEFNRTESDTAAAETIAYYAMKNQDKIVLLSLPDTTLEEIKDLERNRRLITKAIQILESSSKKSDSLNPLLGKVVSELNGSALGGLKESLHLTDEKINLHSLSLKLNPPTLARTDR